MAVANEEFQEMDPAERGVVNSQARLWVDENKQGIEEKVRMLV